MLQVYWLLLLRCIACELTGFIADIAAMISGIFIPHSVPSVVENKGENKGTGYFIDVEVLSLEKNSPKQVAAGCLFILIS